MNHSTCSSTSPSDHLGYKRQITALAAHASGSVVFIDHDFASSSCQHATRAASSSGSVANPVQYRCATSRAAFPTSERRSRISSQLASMKRRQRSAHLANPACSSIWFSRSSVGFTSIPRNQKLTPNCLSPSYSPPGESQFPGSPAGRPMWWPHVIITMVLKAAG